MECEIAGSTPPLTLTLTLTLSQTLTLICYHAGLHPPCAVPLNHSNAGKVYLDAGHFLIKTKHSYNAKPTRQPICLPPCTCLTTAACEPTPMPHVSMSLNLTWRRFHVARKWGMHWRSVVRRRVERLPALALALTMVIVDLSRATTYHGLPQSASPTASLKAVSMDSAHIHDTNVSP